MNNAFEIPRWLSIGLIVVIFLIAFVYARMQGPVDDVDPPGEQMLARACQRHR